METRAHYAAVGVFVLVMVALGFAAVLWLARGALNTQVANYNIYFKGPVTGLRSGAEVDYNGVPVGKVVDIRIVPYVADREKFSQADESELAPPNPDDKNPATIIQVTVEINEDVLIKSNVKASVETNILSGVSYILIVGGSADAPPLQAKEGQRYPVIPSHRSRLASVTARAPELMQKLSDIGDELKELLNEQNRQAFAETLTNLKNFSSTLNDRGKDIAELTTNANVAVKTASTLLDDIDKSYTGPDGLGRQAKTTLADFDRIARNLNDTNKELHQALTDVRPGLRNFSQQTLGDVGNLVTEARQLVTGLNRLTDGLERDPSRVLFGDRREGYRP